jgi:hypothetical protein
MTKYLVSSSSQFTNNVNMLNKKAKIVFFQGARFNLCKNRKMIIFGHF